MSVIKWSGGQYGELPYIKLGNVCFVIRDVKIDGKWKYRLYRKSGDFVYKLHFGKEHKDWLARRAYGERVFLRWYKLKFHHPPYKSNICCAHNVVTYQDKTGRFTYFIDNEKIIRRDHGVAMDWLYNTMAEAKRNAEPIILKELERHERENQTQLTFDMI